MANPVFEAVRTMLAVRDYEDRELPEDVLLRIVEAGRLTASSMNGQPWHFVVVRQRDTLGSLARTGPYIAGAAAAVVVAIERASRFGVSDASRAIQSMMLTACGLELGGLRRVREHRHHHRSARHPRGARGGAVRIHRPRPRQG